MSAEEIEDTINLIVNEHGDDPVCDFPLPSVEGADPPFIELPDGGPCDREVRGFTHTSRLPRLSTPSDAISSTRT